MTDSEFNKLLSEPDKLSGGYLFFGEEDFMKSRYADRFQKAIVGDDTFSAISIDGNEVTPSELAQALGSVSMFGGRRFVRVDHAPVGRWKKKTKKTPGDPKDDDANGEDGILDDYLSIFASAKSDGDVAYVITVDDGAADFGDVAKNKPSALYKKLTEHLTPVYFGAKGGAQLRKWIERHFLAAGLGAEYTAADTLISISGQDMFTLTGECEKLIAYAKAHGESTVTADMVRTAASPTLVEEAFELSNAIISGDKAKALHALYGAKMRREEPIMIMGMISRTIADMLAASIYAASGLSVAEVAKKLKIHEYRATLYLRAAGTDTAKTEAALRKCLEADRLLKSTMHDFTPIERLICSN